MKPVDANEIKLPTDGYRSASELEQFLGYQSNAGKSGEQRPGPVSSQPEAPQPQVSDADPAAIVPNQPEKPRRADKQSRKDEREARAAVPGFSL